MEWTVSNSPSTHVYLSSSDQALVNIIHDILFYHDVYNSQSQNLNKIKS